MERPAIVENGAGADNATYKATITHVAPENRWLKLFVQSNYDVIRHIEDYLEGLEPTLSTKPGFMHQSQIALGTPCFARCSNKWYRAVVSSWPCHNETLVEVTFIDYGNCEEVSVGDVRQIPDPIFRTPHAVSECFLDELDLSFITPQGAEELVLLAKNTLSSAEVTVAVRRLGQVQVNCVRPIVSVTLPDGRSLADMLVRSSAFANAMAQTAVRSAFLLPAIKLGVPYQVYVSHVEAIDNLYVHLATREPSEFTEMIQDAYANVAPLDPSLVHKDTVCLARFTEDSQLYRSLIVDCGQGACKVAFVDYGNHELKPASELFVIPPELLEEPAFAIHCDATSTGLDKDTFVEVTADQKLTCVFLQGVRHGVYAVMFEGLNGSKVTAPTANCVSYNGLSGYVPPTSTSYIQIQQLRLDPGCRHVMYVTYIESTEIFYAQLKEMADDIEQISTQLEAESSSLALLSPADIVPGLAVACRYEGTWYRAVVVQPGPQVQVWIADYGDTTVLDISELRQLDLKYTLQPAYATKLTLDGFTCMPQFSEDLTSLLQSLLLDVEANVSIVDVRPDGTHAVHIFVGDPPKSVVKALSAKLESSRQGVTAKVQLPTVCPVEKLVVTSVTPPQKFFGQFAKVSDEELDALQKALGDHYSKSFPDPAFMPMPGDHVCCRFSEDGQFYRAKIERVFGNGSQYDVFYLDYGNEETVLLQDLRALKPEFAVAPLFGIPCQLQSGEVSEDMVDTEVEVRFLACHGDVHTVAFTTHRQNLPQRDLPAVVAPAQASAPANMNTFGGGEALALGLMQLQLNPGCQERGTVVVVKSPSEFYCQLSKNDDQLNSVAEMLGSVTGMQPSLPPAMRKVGNACCALYSEDGGWYRGIIRELHPGGAAVFFVDYGNVESVANEGLKLLPDALMSVPCQAVGCKLNAAVAVDTTAATARLDEILADQEVTIWVHRCDYNKVHDVDVILPNDVNVRDLLAQEGLLQLPGSSAFPPQPASVPASVPQPPSMQATPLQMSSPQLYHMGGFSYPALTEGVSVPVEVCWVLTPGDVFVQLKETQDVLEQLMSEMQAHYATFGDTVSNDIRPGQACVALYSEDQQWYRARVVHAKAGMLGVQYVDYGNCEEIPEGSVRQGSLKKILAKYAELPAQAIRCRVRSVAPPSGLSAWPILKDQTPLQHIFDGVFLCRPAAQKDGVHLVDLERQGGGPSLVESLVAAGLAADATAMPRELGSASEASQKQPLRAVVSPAEFVFHPKQFVDVKVTAVVSLSEVWCCFVESVEPMAKALQEAGDVAPKFRNPVPGEACVARLPSKDEGAEGDAVLTPWARAVVKSRPSPAKLELFFVDVGGTRVVHHSEVKQILPELTTQPGCAFQCVLNCSFPVDATELSAKILYKELVLQVEQQLEPAKVVGSLFDTSEDSEVNVLDSFAPPPQEEASPPPLVYTPAPETASALQGCSAPEETPISENVAAPEEAPISEAIPEDVSASEEAPIPDVSAPEGQVQESQPPVEAGVVVADTAPPSVEPVAPEPKVTSSAAKRGPPPTRTSPPANTSRPPSRRGSSNRTIVPCYPPLSKISGKMAAYVMHAEDISCFYVMRKEQEEALEELSMRLDAHYTKNPEPVVAPLPRLPCVIFYPQDEAWYRARVAGDSSCVQLVDYGNTDIVPEVREIAAEFLEVPPFCYKCKLDGAIDFAGIPGVFGAFKEMVEGSELELEVMAWGPEVTVRLAKEGQDITTILKSRFLSSEPVAVKTDAQQKPVVFSEATPSSEPPAAVKERKACTVSHVDSLNSFYVQYSTQLDSLPDFVDKLQVVLASTPQTIVETPDSSTLYAALYSADNLWYRARVEGPAEEGGFRVRFVDYGNVETVNSVVSLCSEELLVEPFCVECQLADVKGADDSNVLEKFIDLVLGSILFVETVKSGTPMSVQLFTRDGINLMSKLPLQRRYRSPEVPLHQKALVSIMHIESATDFFVHFNDRQGALETLTQELQEVPENENTSVDLSQPCMAYWSDDLPYRITVLKDKGEAEGASSVPVKFVDYGNTDTVERAGIRELPDALLSEPLFAINCTLDVPEDKLGVEALDKLKVLADEGPTSSLLAEFLGERNGRYVVRLLDMGIDILEKLQGAVHDASRGGSRDVTANSHNESVFKEGTSEGPESVPKAPIVEGENKQNDQVSTDPFSDSVSVSEPSQFSEIEACQGMSDKETGGVFVEAESQEQEGPSDGAPNETPENLQSSEELPKEDTLSEPECNDSSLRVDNDENVAGEPEPLCSAVGGSTELYEAAVLPEGVGVGGAALLAVLNADMLSKVPQFGEKDLSALSEASPRYKEKGDAEAFEDALSKSKREAEIFKDALSEEIATDETKGTSHTAATELIADLHKGTPVKLENAISSLSTASVSDKQSTLAGSGDTHIAETVSSEAHLEKPLKNMDTPASKVGLALKESVTLPSSRLASKDDRSAMGAATVPKATALNIGAGGDGRQNIVPNGTSSADSTPFTRRRFRRRLSLDDCPIPGACTNAELLEIQSSDNVN